MVFSRLNIRLTGDVSRLGINVSRASGRPGPLSCLEVVDAQGYHDFVTAVHGSFVRIFLGSR